MEEAHRAWRFPTEQWTEDGLLIERYGSLLFPVAVSSDTGRLLTGRTGCCCVSSAAAGPSGVVSLCARGGAERQPARSSDAMDVSVCIETPFGQLLVGYDGHDVGATC